MAVNGKAVLSSPDHQGRVRLKGIQWRVEPFPVRAAQLLEFGCIEQAVQRSALWRLGLSNEGWGRMLSGTSHVLYL